MKRGRGRPKGSKKRPTDLWTSWMEAYRHPEKFSAVVERQRLHRMRKASEADEAAARAWSYSVDPSGEWIGIGGARIPTGKRGRGKRNILSRK
jgi:hypothetical protein